MQPYYQPPVGPPPPPPSRAASKSVAAPMSFAGSTSRIFGITRGGPGWSKLLTVPLAVVLVVAVWVLVLCWYLVWGIFLIPYRMIRRGQRKNTKAEAMHREQIEYQQQLARWQAGQQR